MFPYYNIWHLSCPCRGKCTTKHMNYVSNGYCCSYTRSYCRNDNTNSASLLILYITFILCCTEPSEICNDWLRRSSDNHESYQVPAVRGWSQVFVFIALKSVARAPGPSNKAVYRRINGWQHLPLHRLVYLCISNTSLTHLTESTHNKWYFWRNGHLNVGYRPILDAFKAFASGNEECDGLSTDMEVGGSIWVPRILLPICFIYLHWTTLKVWMKNHSIHYVQILYFISSSHYQYAKRRTPNLPPSRFFLFVASFSSFLSPSYSSPSEGVQRTQPRRVR